LDLTVDGRPHRVEVERLAEADVDGTGLDLGFQYRTADAGWGLSLDSGVELEGRGGLDLDPRDVPPDPALAAELDRLLAGGRARLGFDLPWQASMGSGYRVAPAWIAELDLVYSGWSQLDRTAVTYRPDPFGGTDAATEER